MLTTVGKIFVILITAVSLILLGVSTVALTTATDWKAELKKHSETEGKLKGQLTVSEASAADAKKRLETSVADRKTATKAIDNKIAGHEQDTKKLYTDTAATHASLAKQQAEALSNLQEVQARTGDIVKLREQVAAVVAQLGKFASRQGELNAEIVNTRRMVQAAETNSSQISQSH
jgi:chromosome segregation ATPase